MLATLCEMMSITYCNGTMVTLQKRKGLPPKLNFSGGVAYSGRLGDADAVFEILPE